MPTRKESWGYVDGKKIELWTVTHPLDSASSFSVCTFGAILQQLIVPVEDSKHRNIVENFSNVEPYENDNLYFGVIVGRFANRIAGGKFQIDGELHQLERNDGGINHLHGGLKGFNKKIWTASPAEDKVGVVLSYLSEDGEQGYPGAVLVNVTFYWDIETFRDTSERKMCIDYLVTTTKPTPLNLTSHSYFNLNIDYANETKIYDHRLTLFSSSITKLENSIPTGEILSVASTKFDFTRPVQLSKDLLHQFSGGGEPGLDQNFCHFFNPYTNKDGLIMNKQAEVTFKNLCLEVHSSMPGLQVYSANFLPKSSANWTQHSAICLEPQFYPDSPNQPGFPNCIVRPGQCFRSATKYVFRNF